MSAPLRCGQCGAPLPAHAASVAVTCAHCGATASPPPAVVERVVERIVVAPAVGGAPGSAALLCPRCAAPLEAARAERSGRVLHKCMRCAGCWLDRATVEQVRAARDEDLETLARRTLAISVMTHAKRTAAIECPVCHQPFRRVEVPDTIHCIDVCDAHGTWFDRDELSVFAESHAEARAGDVTDEDLEAAGVGGGFFRRLFG